MGKDCGRGNERLGAQALAVCHVAEGEAGESKISQDLLACVSLSKCPESWQTGYLSKETLHVVFQHPIKQRAVNNRVT